VSADRMPEGTGELTPPGTPPVDTNRVHPSLAKAASVGSMQMPASYMHANGETTSRLVMVGVLEEAIRSLRSMSTWLDQNAVAMRVAGVGIEDLRRTRNILAKAVPAVYECAKQVAQNKPSIVPRGG
jgi:hypothetical protein